jgi:hypothetical protein
MSGVHSELDDAAPRDEWLALSDAERAEAYRHAARLESYPLDAIQHTELSDPTGSQSDIAPAQTPQQPPDVDNVMKLVHKLELYDRMRLIARLWESLPPASRVEMITLGLENLEHFSGDAAGGQRFIEPERQRPRLWRFLFDPVRTSELYSAPRRFDLATMFVGTAAYSILFGILTALDAVFDYGPLPLLVLGSIIAAVAVAQSIWHEFANPRGVSVIVGTAAFTLLLCLLAVFHPRADGAALIWALMAGLIAGPVLGYFAGVLVGGVFLVADLFRQPSVKAIDDDVPPPTHRLEFEGRADGHPLDDVPSAKH